VIKHSSLTVSNNDLAAFVQGNANNDGDNDDGDSSDGYEGFLKTFNGDWKQRKIAHWCCWSAIDRRACCATPAAAKKKMKRKARQQLQRVWHRMKNGTKKWGEPQRVSSQLSPLAKCHRLLERGSRPWRRRRRHKADSDSFMEHISDAYQRKKERENPRRETFSWNMIVRTFFFQHQCLRSLCVLRFRN